MQFAMWTLWLVTLGNGSGVAVTPLATFQTQQQCFASYNTILTEVAAAYPKGQATPGIMFCVYGTPVKR